MLRSMFSAVSGIRAHQTMMDVTGNNIANVNTVGYKASRATFQEALTQVVRGATSAAVTDMRGGINPMQLGLGTRVASIDGIFTQGASQLTGRSLDVAIQGDGLLVVDNNGTPMYTRAGALTLDANGKLVGPAGEVFQGWNMDAERTPGTETDLMIEDLETYTDIAVGADGTITGRDMGGEVVLGKLALATFNNPGGLTRVGGSLFAASFNSGDPEIGTPGTGPRGTLQGATLEMSNVDLAAEFTNLILAQRGFQANTRIITASDEVLQDLVNLKR